MKRYALEENILNERVACLERVKDVAGNECVYSERMW